MPVEILTKLGVHTIRVTGDDLSEAMQLSGFLAELPDHCPVCAKGVRGEPGEEVKVSLFFRETQEGHTYYGLRCKALGSDAHETSFGRLKKAGKGGAFWYKGDWHKVGDYNKENASREQRPAQPARSGGAFEDE